jgi:hypothetical protein
MIGILPFDDNESGSDYPRAIQDVFVNRLGELTGEGALLDLLQ